MNIGDVKVKIQIEDDDGNMVSMCDSFTLDQSYDDQYSYDADESQGDVNDLVRKFRNLLTTAGVPNEVANKLIFATPSNIAKLKLLEK